MSYYKNIIYYILNLNLKYYGLINWQDTLCAECMRLCMSLGLLMSPARYQDNRISWQDTLCDECMRLYVSGTCNVSSQISG